MLTVGTVAMGQQLPQPSPLGKVEQIVGLTTVKIEYSRPSAKGRVVFGDLVPYGQLWRTGANGCTKIKFDGPVMINEYNVPAGTYSLLSVPSDGPWTVYLNRDTTLWGTDGYDATKNVAEIKAQNNVHECTTETFTIDIEGVKDDVATIQLRWERSTVSFDIKADATEKAMANIKEAMAAKEIKAGTYHRCARFYLDRGVNNVQALDWAKKADQMEERYWMKHTLALCYAANGMKKEAIAAAEASMKLAEAEKDEQYMKLNQAKIAEWSK